MYFSVDTILPYLVSVFLPSIFVSDLLALPVLLYVYPSTPWFLFFFSPTEDALFSYLQGLLFLSVLPVHVVAQFLFLVNVIFFLLCRFFCISWGFFRSSWCIEEIIWPFEFSPPLSFWHTHTRTHTHTHTHTHTLSLSVPPFDRKGGCQLHLTGNSIAPPRRLNSGAERCDSRPTQNSHSSPVVATLDVPDERARTVDPSFYYHPRRRADLLLRGHCTFWNGHPGLHQLMALVEVRTWILCFLTGWLIMCSTH